MKRQNISRTPKTISTESGKSIVRTATARFTFRNGDSYEGKYKIDVGRHILVKQDEGVYATDNFDIYHGKWQDDKFASGEFHIRYNNDAQYKGNVGTYGAMNDRGTYIFPDDSSLTAVWSQNKPISDVVYKGSDGHEWTTKSISDNQVLLTTGNHFWDEICETSLEKNQVFST